MHELKKNERHLRLLKKRIYRTAISLRLRNTPLGSKVSIDTALTSQRTEIINYKNCFLDALLFLQSQIIRERQ